VARSKIRFRETLLRLFGLCGGLGLVVLGLIGRNAAGDKVQLWRRGAVIAGGLFFLYCGSMYYWPKYRRVREQLDREWEQECRELERDSK
jgi:hypothetical protein